MKFKPVLFFLIVILLSFHVFSATISGNVYNYDLELENRAMVTVNSVPVQKQIIQDGTYSLELQTGTYIIEAYNIDDEELRTSENLTIINNSGNYKLDLFLFYEPSNIVDENIDLSLPKEDDYFLSNKIIISFILVLVILFVLVYLLARKNKGSNSKIIISDKKINSLDDQIKNDIIHLLKANHGLMTQKNIRKNFNYSESKISLIIKDLEKEEIVSKEKRGTINYIKLK